MSLLQETPSQPTARHQQDNFQTSPQCLGGDSPSLWQPANNNMFIMRITDWGKTNWEITHSLGILLMNSNCCAIYFQISIYKLKELNKVLSIFDYQLKIPVHCFLDNSYKFAQGWLTALIFMSFNTNFNLTNKSQSTATKRNWPRVTIC